MRSGNLRHTVKVYEQVNIKDAAGGNRKQWNFLFDRKMGHESFLGSKRQADGKIVDPQLIYFRCRYNQTLFDNNKLRFDFNGVMYEASGAPQLIRGKFRELLFPAKRVVNIDN